jgi:hypothetical protein
MAELTQPELKAICRVLAHFLDGGWTEIMESPDEEEVEMLFDNIESAHEKLSRASCSKAARTQSFVLRSARLLALHQFAAMICE